jgi:formylglycine-generating enzyme required for sulfatase activity
LSTITGKSFRLPTEAEWEYACRAGSVGQWCFGDSEEDASDVWKDVDITAAGESCFDEDLKGRLKDYAWFGYNSRSQTHPVGQKKPNAFGLFDMHGNVSEWCSDWYGNYESSSLRNPTGPSSGSSRVARGGGWSSKQLGCRSATRGSCTPYYRLDDIGFRVVAVPAAGQ